MISDDEKLFRTIGFLMEDAGADPAEGKGAGAEGDAGHHRARQIWANANVEARRRRAARLAGDMRDAVEAVPRTLEERVAARARIRTLIANDDGFLTLAARGGSDALDDADLDAIIDNLDALRDHDDCDGSA